MKVYIKARDICFALSALLLLATQAVSTSAQCAMCKASVQGAASSNPQAVADTFNLAVLVLLIPPVLIFSAIFLLLLRYRSGKEESGVEALDAAGALR